MINILWNCALKTNRKSKGRRPITVFSASSFLEDVTQSFSAFRRMSFARRATFHAENKTAQSALQKEDVFCKTIFFFGAFFRITRRIYTRPFCDCEKQSLTEKLSPMRKLSSLFVSVKDGLISAPNYIHLWVGAIIHFLSFVQRQPGFHDWEVSNAHRRLFLWVFKEWKWKLLNRLIAKSDIKHSPNTTLLLLCIENHNVAFTVFYCFCI